MSASHAHDIPKQVRAFIWVFVALLVGTVVTVGLNAVHFDNVAVTVAVALFVAIIKAVLVAGFFMHLISERKAIYAVLLATVFFFAGLMFLTVWARDQVPVGTVYSSKHAGSSAPAAHLPH
jgi:cytochrome c oxidase subunit IV